MSALRPVPAARAPSARPAYLEAMERSFAFDTATWRVHDLARARAFYEGLGFAARPQGEDAADLWPAGDTDRSGPPVLRLVADAVAVDAAGRGAYHVALRVPTRRDLAATVHRVAVDALPVEGFADHLVSEALYLPDPEGHGLEIMHDRPRSSWAYPAGKLVIGTEPLDLDDLLAELGPDPSRSAHLPAGTDVGHVHLFADDVAADAHWYERVLGMETIVQFGPWGTFLAADGYHHHVGLRRGVGATDPKRDHGLCLIEARVPGERFERAPADAHDGAKTLHAPSGHAWRLRPFV